MEVSKQLLFESISASTTMKVIGIFMEDRKYKSLGFPRFVQFNRPDNIQFKKICGCEDLKNQGRFDVIVHKSLHLMSNIPSSHNAMDFASLKDYFQSNEVIVIDPIDSITPLLDRYRQYDTIRQSLSDSGLQHRVYVPRFCLYDDTLDADSLNNNKMKFPILVKPLMAHGKEIAHEMMLIFNEFGLKKVRPPALLQNFENHGGFLIKAYVIGAFYHLVIRPSIRDFCKGDHEPIQFCSHDVSKETSHSTLNDLKSVSTIDDMKIDHELVHQVIMCLRQQLHLDLFGIDFIICPPDDTDVSKLAIIDANIFPDYSCVPDFFMHFENLCRQKLGVRELTSPIDMDRN